MVKVTMSSWCAASLAAVRVYCPPPAGADRAYGVLAAYAARHALAVEGPIREYYLVGQHDTLDTSEWVTEIGWPIFRTGSVVTRPGPAPSLGIEGGGGRR
jgi:hypothetical protein